jgi:hypothetical protein
VSRYRLRQVALVARALAPVEDDLRAIFGLEVAFRDPAVAKFGLENIVVPVGDQFLEVVAPTVPGTTAGRYLERRGGDGGYMAILQCDDAAARDARVAALGIRTVHAFAHDGYDGLQLHPRDTGGTFLEIDQAEGFDRADGDWHPAGEHWRAARRTEVACAILAAEIQSPAPAELAARWSAILGRPAESRADAAAIPLEQGALRFVAAADGRGEGLGGIDIALRDGARARREAARRGRLAAPDRALIGGVRFNLIDMA